MQSHSISQQVFWGAESDKPILKFIWKCKGPGIVKTTLKKNKVKGLRLPAFKTKLQRYGNQDTVLLMSKQKNR